MGAVMQCIVHRGGWGSGLKGMRTSQTILVPSGTAWRRFSVLGGFVACNTLLLVEVAYVEDTGRVPQLGGRNLRKSGNR